MLRRAARTYLPRFEPQPSTTGRLGPAPDTWRAMAPTRPPPFPLRFSPDPAHVEVIDFEIGRTPRADSVASLAPEEQVRAERFLFARDRVRFVNARAGLRRVLGACLGVEPSAVAFAYEPKGKPVLERGVAAAAIKFNLSHSGDRAVVAVTVGRELGVDVEHLRREVDHAGIAAFFTPGERAALQRGSEDERRSAFYRCWVAKESYLKARGDGLTSSLDAFEVDVADSGLGLRWSSLGDPPGRWRIEALDLCEGYASAVTSEAGAWGLRRWSELELAADEDRSPRPPGES